MNGFVRIHITLFEHSVDLSLRGVYNLLQALHYFSTPRRNIISPSAAAEADLAAAAHLVSRENTKKRGGRGRPRRYISVEGNPFSLERDIE